VTSAFRFREAFGLAATKRTQEVIDIKGTSILEPNWNQKPDGHAAGKRAPAQGLGDDGAEKAIMSRKWLRSWVIRSSGNSDAEQPRWLGKIR
jgi:hypothetical protein